MEKIAGGKLQEVYFHNGLVLVYGSDEKIKRLSEVYKDKYVVEAFENGENEKKGISYMAFKIEYFKGSATYEKDFVSGKYSYFFN
jgi:hypothetical protein